MSVGEACANPRFHPRLGQEVDSHSIFHLLPSRGTYDKMIKIQRFIYKVDQATETKVVLKSSVYLIIKLIELDCW